MRVRQAYYQTPKLCRAMGRINMSLELPRRTGVYLLSSALFSLHLSSLFSSNLEPRLALNLYSSATTLVLEEQDADWRLEGCKG